MSITRLQQARQMYAMGQRVAKTLDGSRPGYRGEGAYQGGTSSKSSSSSKSSNTSGAGKQDTGNPRDDYIANYVSKSIVKGGGSKKPGTSGTKPSDYNDAFVTGDQGRSAQRDFIQTLNTNNAIRANQLGTKFTPYGGGSKNYKEPFFDTGLGKFVKGVGMFYAPQIFGPKFATGMKAYKVAKVAKDFLDERDVINTLDVKNPIADLFNGNKTSTTKSTTKNNTTTNNGGDGDGIASLANQAAGYDEYILLLQKLQSGNISDSEQNRFNVLKNMLGI